MGIIRQARKLSPEQQQEFITIRSEANSTKTALEKFHEQYPDLKDKFTTKDAQNCYYRHRIKEHERKPKVPRRTPVLPPDPVPKPDLELSTEEAPKREQLMLVINEPAPEEPKSRKNVKVPDKAHDIRWTKELKERIAQRVISLRKLSLRWNVISEKVQQEFELDFAPSISYLRILWKNYAHENAASRKNCTVVITSSNIDLTAHVTKDRLSSILLTLVKEE